MRTQRRLTWTEVELLVSLLKKKLADANLASTPVYGIPTGGSVVATLLSKSGTRLLDAPESGCVVVDDICDSGWTLKPYLAAHLGISTAVLHCRPQSASIPKFIVEATDDWIAYPWEHEVAGEDLVTRTLELIGEDPTREGLVGTPGRVVRAWKELFSGYGQEPKVVTFEQPYDQMVVLRNIEFYSTCEHHMLPFFGQVHVAYIPLGKVIGISKLARLVEVFSRRLQIQERLTEQIAGALEEGLKPLGVGVMVEAQHLCMTARGISKQNSVMVTSALKGTIMTKPEARAEFLSLVNGRKGMGRE